MGEFEIPDWCRALLEPQDEAARKRLLLLETAFDVIAEVGFEGLRTRTVSTRAGVNIATLHYYFPSKQDLVEGLAELMGAKFVTIHGPRPAATGYPALDRLRQEFSDGRYYFKHEPRMLLVMQEFTMRGKRDSEVQKVVEQMHFHWRHGIERMVIEGVKDGTFRADLDPKAMIAMLMSIFSGIAVAGGDKIGEIERSTESWILSDKVKKQLQKRGAAK
jgi:TetR/AcrR family transcriptional regulator, regulator of cefoperazone and chloramphenicol sensitivity